MKKFQATRFLPFAEIGRRLSDGGKDLDYGLIVKFAVLPDVEGGEMKSEDVEGATNRPDRAVRQSFGADIRERLVEQSKVFIELVGLR